MFTPRWKKEAQLVLKSGKKFLNYKRDLLKPDRISEIQARIDDLKLAIKGRGKEAEAASKEAVKQLDSTCEKSLPRYQKPDVLAENIEVIFVSLVVALGIRSYYAQPFRIPTGSMQPTLNGVIATPVEKKEWPNPITRVAELAVRGRAYIHAEAKKDLIIPREVIAYSQTGRLPSGFVVQNPGFYQRLQTFHTVSRIQFENGHVMVRDLPSSELTQGRHQFNIFNTLRNNSVQNSRGQFILPKGTILFSGTVDSGDLIIADKVSYHFRKPKRGEVYIFDTRGIDTSGGSSQQASQMGATHYIKRCVGIPGDTLQIDSPDLLVNGKPAEEKYIQRVMRAEKPYDLNPGYVLTNSSKTPLGTTDATLRLRDNRMKPWMAEYAAMGDNTRNSLDSRYWGSVKEFNVVAPAFLSLWPFTTGHWGLIK